MNAASPAIAGRRPTARTRRLLGVAGARSARRSARRRRSRGKILYLENLTVSFDGFKALNELTLYVDPGELRCIIGPNGAGKTTMMDVITGKTRPDQGSAWFGRDDRPAGADRARDRAGRHRPQVPEADACSSS